MKVNLNFMVVPEDLKTMARVKDKVAIRILNSDSIHLKGFLGESGKALAKAGARFYFTKDIALFLIKRKVAVKVVQ